MATTGARVGERLRAIRRQKGLSLHDVEARSSLEFKASVLGAYERGERAISVPRLLRLAEIYEVPADQLLPREFDGEISLVDGASSTIDQTNGFAIDLVRLHDVDDPDAQMLSPVRVVDPARAPGLQRPDAHDPAFRPAGARRAAWAAASRSSAAGSSSSGSAPPDLTSRIQAQIRARLPPTSSRPWPGATLVRPW